MLSLDIVYCLCSWNTARIKCYDFANSQNWGAASRHSKHCFKKKLNESSLFRSATKPWANEYLCWMIFTSWFRPHPSFERGWIDSSESALCFCSQFYFYFFQTCIDLCCLTLYCEGSVTACTTISTTWSYMRWEWLSDCWLYKVWVAALPFCRLSSYGHNLRDGTVSPSVERVYIKNCEGQTKKKERRHGMWKISIFHHQLRPPLTACQKARFLKGSTRWIFVPRKRKKHFSAGCEGALTAQTLCCDSVRVKMQLLKVVAHWIGLS